MSLTACSTSTMLQRSSSLLARGGTRGVASRASRAFSRVTAASAETSYTAQGIAAPRAGFHFLHIDDFSKDQLGRAHRAWQALCLL